VKRENHFISVLKFGKKLLLSVSIFLLFGIFSSGRVFANDADIGNSSISVSQGSIPADGSTTSTISVIARDSNSNVLSGDRITANSSGDSGLVINGGNAGADNATVITDSNGSANFTVSSNNSSPTTDTFTIISNDPDTITLGTATVTFTALSSPTPTSTPGSCADTPPGSTPSLTSAVATGDNQITLTWTDATDPVSYYLLAYGTAAGQYVYGNPNIGGQGTINYVVGSLSKGSTYYFAIKAVNGCNTGSFSNEISATTTGGTVEDTSTPTQSPSDNISSDTDNQDTVTPTDTPGPSQILHMNGVPVPAHVPPAASAGISKTKIIEYILAFILIFGGIGGFIHWKHQKNTKKLRNLDEDGKPQDDLKQKKQHPPEEENTEKYFSE